jgi:hypothetical protein
MPAWDTARHPGQAHSGTFIVVNGYVDDKLCAVRGCEASRLSAGTGIPTAPVSYYYQQEQAADGMMDG